jgi:hypothetical protein
LNKAEQLIFDKLSTNFPKVNIQIKLNKHQVQIELDDLKMNCWKDEWEDKQSIIIYRIKSLLGQNKRIHGRSCEIKLLDKNTAEFFLNQHHIMGFAQSYYKLGLYKNDELLAIATFSKGRKMNRLPEGKKSFELIRFCNASGITVVGGLSKLLKYFINLTDAGDIMTYIDKDHSEGKAFLKLGFKLHSVSNPIAFKVDKNSQKRMNKNIKIDDDEIHLVKNSGNLKLVYTPHHEEV